MFPPTLLVSLQNVSVINATKNQSVHSSSSGVKPWVKFTNNRQIVADNIMPNKCFCVFKKLNTFRDWLRITRVIIYKRLLGIEIVDANTVDFGDIIV